MKEIAIAHAKRASECARFANLTPDETLRAELLRLRQRYLAEAARLGIPMHEAINLGSNPDKG